MENMEKWKFSFAKVLLVINYVRTNFFSTRYVHFCLVSYFHNQHLDFIPYTSLCLINRKTHVQNI